MFSISGRNLPTVRDYQSALRVYENAVQVKDSDWRHLVNKRDSSKRVRKNEQGHVAFRFHNTDLVTWVSSTQVHVVLWSSVSSAIFANAFLPRDLDYSNRGNYTNVNGYVDQSDGLTFNFVDGEWRVDESQCRCFETYKVDRKDFNVAKKKVAALCQYIEARKTLESKGIYRGASVTSIARILRDFSPHAEYYPQLFAYLAGNTAEQIARAQCALDGVIKAVKLEPGVIPERSPWAPFV